MTTTQTEQQSHDDAEYQVCAVCGGWRAYMGNDVTCDECGACDWQDADEDGNLLPRGE